MLQVITVMELLLLVVTACVIGALLIKGSKDAAKIHSVLDQFERRAKEANTKDECQLIYAELVVFAKKEYWAREFSDRVSSILAYMQGKFSVIDNKKS
jgi:hypothetical protein